MSLENGLEDGMVPCACPGYEVIHEHGANLCREPIEAIRLAQLAAVEEAE